MGTFALIILTMMKIDYKRKCHHKLLIIYFFHNQSNKSIFVHNSWPTWLISWITASYSNLEAISESG